MERLTGFHSIQPLSALPTITDAVIIDGTTEPDFAGTPVIELDGSSAGAGANWLKITAGGSTVRGLAINNFDSAAIRLEAGANGNTVAGNVLGLDVDGSTTAGNLFGLHVSSANNTIEGNVICSNNRGILLNGGGAAGNTVRANLIGTNAGGNASRGNATDGVKIRGGSASIIGGPTAADGNSISANFTGVSIQEGSANNTIQHNLIGTKSTGDGNRGNFVGVNLIATPDNTIKDTVVAGSKRQAVRLTKATTTGTLIENNLIGLDATGTVAIATNFDGIRISKSPSNTIRGNVIANSGFNGIRLLNTGATGNAIRGNSIFDNAGSGIDLKPPNGPTDNDLGDADSGANNLQNFPEITAAALVGGNVNIMYSVPSTIANSAYNLTIEFFLADSSNQEGEVFLGSASYTDASNLETDSITIPGGVTVNAGDQIVATATNANGNTSEFSASIAVTAAAPLLAAGGEAIVPSSRVLTTADVDPLLGYAITAWAEAGINDNQLARLEGLQVTIADLSGARLGEAFGNMITLDINAAGHGWFIDPTPSDDSEFRSPSGLSTLDAKLRTDLLTVIFHELGHVIGLEDDYSNPDSDDIMNGWLGTGTRRLPSIEAIDCLMAEFAANDS